MSSLQDRKALQEKLRDLQKSIFLRRVVENLTASGSVDDKSMCMAWARDCVQDVFGKQFDEFFYKGSALGSAKAFINSPYARHPRVGSMPGDILFFTRGHGEFGHVGIRVFGNYMLENSSLHWDGHDGRGGREITRRLIADVDLIVRLPLVLSNNEKAVYAWKKRPDKLPPPENDGKVLF